MTLHTSLPPAFTRGSVTGSEECFTPSLFALLVLLFSCYSVASGNQGFIWSLVSNEHHHFETFDAQNVSIGI